MAQYPQDLRYSPQHVWVREGDGSVRVGLSEDLEEELSDIESIDLPEAGDELEIDMVSVSVHLPSDVVHFSSPLTGRVLSKNTRIEEKPGDVFLSPFDQGWLFEMEVDDPAEFELLMNADEYAQFVEE